MDDIHWKRLRPGTLSPPAAIWALKSRNSLDGWKVSSHDFSCHIYSATSADWEPKSEKLGIKNTAFRHILHHTVEQGSSCKFSMSASFLFLFCTATVLMLLTSCWFELLRRRPHFVAKLFQVRLVRMKQTARLRSTRHNCPDSNCTVSWLHTKHFSKLSLRRLHCNHMMATYTIHSRIARRGNCSHHTSQCAANSMSKAMGRDFGRGTSFRVSRQGILMR